MRRYVYELGSQCFKSLRFVLFVWSYRWVYMYSNLNHFLSQSLVYTESFIHMLLFSPYAQTPFTHSGCFLFFSTSLTLSISLSHSRPRKPQKFHHTCTTTDWNSLCELSKRFKQSKRVRKSQRLFAFKADEIEINSWKRERKQKKHTTQRLCSWA